MKRFLGEMRLSIRENLRTMSRWKLSKQGHEDSIRRRFKNIDISKDFENRLKSQDVKFLESKNLTTPSDLNNLNLSQLEDLYAKKKEDETEIKKSDIYQKTIVKGIKKDLCLAEIDLLETYDKSFDDIKLHPRIKENLERIQYSLIHNIPIEKYILFEALPHMFAKELGQLNNEERSIFPRRKLEFVSDDGVYSTGQKLEMQKVNEYTLENKIWEMKFSIFYEWKDLYDRHSIFFKQAVDQWGWVDKYTYLHAIMDKDEGKLTFGESLIRDEVTQINQMQEEVEALEKAFHSGDITSFKEPLTFFPISKELQMKLNKRMEFIEKYRTFNLEDTFIVPYSPREETILEKLRKEKDFDVDSVIESDRRRYLDIINSGRPIQAKDPKIKDEEIVYRTNLIQRVIQPPNEEEILRPKIPNSSGIALDILEEQMQGHLPAPNRIHVEEYYKTLFLNETNKIKYDFDFWVKYYEVDATTLRNIFNYVFFPVANLNKPDEINRVLYFKDAEYEDRRKLIANMTHEEYEEYLLRTVQRPELQETKRLEYLEYAKTAQEPRVSERTVLMDLHEDEAFLASPLVNSDLMRKIDEDIFNMSQVSLESRSIELDPDLRLRIDELKAIKQERDEEERRLLIGGKRNKDSNDVPLDRDSSK